MSKKSYLLEGIRITEALINDIIFLCETRMKETYFTRIRNNKMTFKSILIFILNFVKKILQLELDNFFSGVNGTNFTVTKQAFSEARQKISPTAFIKMSDGIIKWFYKDTDYKRFKGYRLLSIDGTAIEINNTEKLRKEFGDIEDDMIITSVLSKYRANERAQAEELINKLDDLGFDNDTHQVI